MISKKNINLLLANLLLFSGYALGQSTCNCLDNLQQAIQRVEADYAGFPDKITEKNDVAYARLKDRLKKRAISLNDPIACYGVLSDYVNYFYDKHFRIEYNAPIDSVVIEIDAEQVMKTSTTSKPNSITGIWKNPEGTEIAIFKQKDRSYQAVKLVSAADDFPKGFVYFTLTPKGNNYTVKLYNRKINLEIPAKQVGNLLRIWNFQLWAKVGNAPLSEGEKAEWASWQEHKKGLLFKKLNPDLAYLKIPTFDGNEGAIQSLVSENDSVIRNSKYLIIDLTGNAGGSAGWVALMPYLMTNQVNQKSSLLRVSKANVTNKLRDLEPFVKSPIPNEYKKYFPKETLAQYQKAYRDLPSTSQVFYPTPAVNFPLEAVLKYPEKVALIVDDFGGSATEYFFYLTKQSKKVISYGEPTIGMMDYVGMSIPTALPYKAFKLYIPIEKSSWTDEHPIDRTGFEPQVPIAGRQEDWLTYIIKDLPSRPLNL
ncbi:MAG: S41 family peptidase [Pseudosphingobacterium sp.]|nr:S41 family peptidase [Olivibacter sp. UJ_SKK_5.1]MDX3915535.1 S41 family peptidase [Pseudosphingobacterium sp.]